MEFDEIVDRLNGHMYSARSVHFIVRSVGPNSPLLETIRMFASTADTPSACGGEVYFPVEIHDQPRSRYNPSDGRKKPKDACRCYKTPYLYWLKMLFCLLLVFIVVTVERGVYLLIRRKIETIPSVDGEISWARLILKAVMRPLSLLIWVYGIYGALSPLYSHFQGADGSNLVHLVLQKTATVGGILAFFWFIYQFVHVMDARLSQWADSTESTIDDILVPLFGKTLRIFIVILAGIIVVQNLTGVEIGPLLASLGIGGLAVALAAKDSIANFFGTLTILFDKPFQVGERIVIDNYDGVVEDVGFPARASGCSLAPW